MEAWPSVAAGGGFSTRRTHVRELKFGLPPTLMYALLHTSYRPEVLSRARERASRLTEIAVSEASEAAEEALATTDACVEGVH